MNPLNYLAVVLILASSAFAQSPGLFVSIGGGMAQLTAGSFTQTIATDFTQQTVTGENLKPTERTDRVSVRHFGIGYQFDQNWAVLMCFADYSTAEVNMGYPAFPGFVPPFGLKMPYYSRNVLKYDSSRFSVVPTYSFALNKRLRLHVGAGLSRSTTDSRFETIYHVEFSGRPSGTFWEISAKEKVSAWSWLASFGADFALTKNLSIGITGDYAPFEIKVMPAPNSTFGPARPSKSKVAVDCFEANLSVIWRL